MDRLASDLDKDHEGSTHLDAPAIPLNASEETLLEHSVQRLSVPERLLNLAELEVLYETEARALWTFMRPANRPSFTLPMLHDFEQWQELIVGNFGPGKLPIDYLVLGSRSPGVFCLGGDLELFHGLIRAGNRDGLVHYGNRCVEILHRNMRALDLPMITVGLVQGQALGGGFEALLSFDHIIAERGTTFGLPEIVFGLFPGMGAHAFLSRKLGTAMADRMILSSETYSAEAMYEMGIVQQLAAPGEGVDAVRKFITRSERKHSGLIGARRAMRAAAPIGLSELRIIVGHWADAALQLSESDLKLMTRLASAQVRLAKAG
ncbi:MAG: crotonase/enoyl-CoA hydratase family protein [Novosphingobium sp.]